MTSWFDLLKEQMKNDGEDFPSRVCTLSEDQLRVEFDEEFGVTEGQPFTAWGKDWVYFPVSYDGAEWVGKAPRNPCNISMEHQGGPKWS